MAATSGATDQVDAGAEVAQAFPVTDRKGWIAVLGIAIVFVGVVGWMAFGQLPQEVRGDAVIIPTSGFVDVGRDQIGAVSALLVAPGDQVAANAVVARVQTPRGLVDVTAPVEGTIANIFERVGGTTSPGQPLMTMSASADGERAVTFLPAGSGNAVQIGMDARVALAAYPQSQFGTIDGKVASVSTLPVTTERLEVVLGGNDSLVRYFVDQGPLIEVTVALDPEPASATGYDWTIGEGPDRPIPVGSLGEASVIIADGSPLARFFG